MEKNLKTTLYAYNYDLDNPHEKAEYDALVKRLKESGLDMFGGKTAIDVNNDGQFQVKHVNPLNGKEIELETEYVFNDQWNSAPTATSETGLRLFDWHDVHPIHNPRRRFGYYLEQTQEMKELRAKTYKCGFCGRQYQQHDAPLDNEFCLDCIGSQYLKESKLNLLRLYPANIDRFSREIPELTEQERDRLVPLYREQQKKCRLERERKALDDAKENAKEKLRHAEIEYDGKIWLIENNINPKNWIYYHHRNTFCYGWNTPVTEKEAAEMRKRLAGFEYAYEIKTR